MLTVVFSEDLVDISLDRGLVFLKPFLGEDEPRADGFESERVTCHETNPWSDR